MESSDWDSFGEDNEERLTKDVELLKRCHSTNGYREGLEEGQQFVLQSSFNEGFSKSVKAYSELGLIKGIVSAIMVIAQQDNKENEDLIVKCQDVCNTISAVQGSNASISPPWEADSSKHMLTGNSSSAVKDMGVDTDSKMDLILSNFHSLLDSTKAETSAFVEGADNLSGGALLTPHACVCGKTDSSNCVGPKDSLSVDSLTFAKKPELCSNGLVEVPCDMHTLQTCCLQLLRESGLEVVT